MPQGRTLGGSTSINPATGPSDNLSVASIVLQSQGTYTGTISVDNGTGVVSISNAAPIGSHTITIRATDNCGAFTDASFTLNVTNNPPVITAGEGTTASGARRRTSRAADRDDCRGGGARARVAQRHDRDRERPGSIRGQFDRHGNNCSIRHFGDEHYQ